MTLTLILWLTSGDIIREPVTYDNCRALIGAARYADAAGAVLSRDGAGEIAALSCGDVTVVLQLPTSAGPCEAGA